MQQTYFRFLIVFILSMMAIENIARAATTDLALPTALIALPSEKGEKRFAQTPQKDKQDYWQLSRYFTAENGTAFCGIASSAMVLNALGIKPKLAPQHAPYKIFTQQNIFYNTKILNAGISPPLVTRQGLSLNQLCFMLKQYASNVHCYDARDIKDLKSFRTRMTQALEKPDHYVIVNFSRKGLGEVGDGHFSPISAYDPASDCFLLMDVAPYKYPQIWVPARLLFHAIQKNKTTGQVDRGIIIVSA